MFGQYELDACGCSLWPSTGGRSVQSEDDSTCSTDCDLGQIASRAYVEKRPNFTEDEESLRDSGLSPTAASTSSYPYPNIYDMHMETFRRWAEVSYEFSSNQTLGRETAERQRRGCDLAESVRCGGSHVDLPPEVQVRIDEALEGARQTGKQWNEKMRQYWGGVFEVHAEGESNRDDDSESGRAKRLDGAAARGGREVSSYAYDAWAESREIEGEWVRETEEGVHPEDPRALLEEDPCVKELRASLDGLSLGSSGEEDIGKEDGVGWEEEDYDECESVYSGRHTPPCYCKGTPDTNCVEKTILPSDGTSESVLVSDVVSDEPWRPLWPSATTRGASESPLRLCVDSPWPRGHHCKDDEMRRSSRLKRGASVMGGHDRGTLPSTYHGLPVAPWNMNAEGGASPAFVSAGLLRPAREPPRTTVLGDVRVPCLPGSLSELRVASPGTRGLSAPCPPDEGNPPREMGRFGVLPVDDSFGRPHGEGTFMPDDFSDLLAPDDIICGQPVLARSEVEQCKAFAGVVVGTDLPDERRDNDHNQTREGSPTVDDSFGTAHGEGIFMPDGFSDSLAPEDIMCGQPVSAQSEVEQCEPLAEVVVGTDLPDERRDNDHSQTREGSPTVASGSSAPMLRRPSPQNLPAGERGSATPPLNSPKKRAVRVSYSQSSQGFDAAKLQELMQGRTRAPGKARPSGGKKKAWQYGPGTVTERRRVAYGPPDTAGIDQGVKTAQPDVALLMPGHTLWACTSLDILLGAEHRDTFEELYDGKSGGTFVDWVCKHLDMTASIEGQVVLDELLVRLNGLGWQERKVMLRRVKRIAKLLHLVMDVTEDITLKEEYKVSLDCGEVNTGGFVSLYGAFLKGYQEGKRNYQRGREKDVVDADASR
ncbi:hypothetical protein PQX77_020861 [Marasmius sp. AFHP31]|nr:hypothetical protein PQX77_020861 [Marasmius sp. AFHP31]